MAATAATAAGMSCFIFIILMSFQVLGPLNTSKW